MARVGQKFVYEIPEKSLKVVAVQNNGQPQIQSFSADRPVLNAGSPNPLYPTHQPKNHIVNFTSSALANSSMASKANSPPGIPLLSNSVLNNPNNY